MKLCRLQESCQSFTNGSKRRSHHIRITEKCKWWNDEYCTHKIAGVKIGDACKMKRLKKK